MDISPDLFALQAKALTGCQLNNETNEIQVIPAADWYRLKSEYSIKARDHFENCGHKQFNLWNRVK